MKPITEEWRDVVGFEGIYKISSMGGLRGPLFGDKRNLVPVWDVYGYAYNTLCRNKGKDRLHRLRHHLVAEAFIGPRQDKMQVNHINGIKADNSVANLEYVTAKENTQHAIHTGLITKRRGDECSWSKLNETKVRELRAEYVSSGHYGWFPKKARELGIPSITIYQAVKGINWSHVR